MAEAATPPEPDLNELPDPDGGSFWHPDFYEPFRGKAAAPVCAICGKDFDSDPEEAPEDTDESASPTERSVVNDAAKKALDVLVSIVEDTDAGPDVRIRAASAILHQEIQERVNPVGATA